MTWRSRVAVAALVVAMVAGCSSPSGSTAVHATSGNSGTSTSAPAAHGVEAAIGVVPWAQVGPGWMLATWSPVPGRHHGGGSPPPPGSPTPETAITTLYLVNPAGGRYLVTAFPPAGGGASPQLADWSGHGSHALFYAANAPGPPTVVTVDLRSGTQTTFPVDNGLDVVARYTRPEGKGVLLAKRRDTEPAWLRRVDLSGHQELTYPVAPDFQGSYLSARDGAQLVLGAAAGLTLMGNDGVARNALPIAGESLCEPTRWWDAGSTIVVTRCSDNGLSRLWLVPIDGGPPTALTAPLSGQGPDYGDMNAWQLPAGTFIQDAGACGYEYLAKLSAVGGTTAAVSVLAVNPGSSVRVIGVNAGHLDLQATGACGAAASRCSTMTLPRARRPCCSGHRSTAAASSMRCPTPASGSPVTTQSVQRDEVGVSPSRGAARGRAGQSHRSPATTQAWRPMPVRQTVISTRTL